MIACICSPIYVSSSQFANDFQVFENSEGLRQSYIDSEVRKLDDKDQKPRSADSIVTYNTQTIAVEPLFLLPDDASAEKVDRNAQGTYGLPFFWPIS